MSSKRGRNRNSAARSDKREIDPKGSPESSKSESKSPEASITFQYETDDGLRIELSPLEAEISREYEITESDFIEFSAGIDWSPSDFKIEKRGLDFEASGELSLPGDLLGISGGIIIDLQSGEIEGGELGIELGGVDIEVQVDGEDGCRKSISISFLGFGIGYGRDDCEDDEEEDEEGEGSNDPIKKPDPKQPPGPPPPPPRAPSLPHVYGIIGISFVDVVNSDSAGLDGIRRSDHYDVTDERSIRFDSPTATLAADAADFFSNPYQKTFGYQVVGSEYRYFEYNYEMRFDSGYVFVYGSNRDSPLQQSLTYYYPSIPVNQPTDPFLLNLRFLQLNSTGSRYAMDNFGYYISFWTLSSRSRSFIYSGFVDEIAEVVWSPRTNYSKPTFNGGGYSSTTPKIDFILLSESSHSPPQQQKIIPPSPPPRRTNPMNDCCRETTKLMREIHKHLGISELRDKGVVFPNRLIAAGAKGYTKVDTMLDFLELIVREVDHLGIHPHEVVIKDVDPGTPGDQKISAEFVNATAWAQSLMENSLKSDGEADARLNLQVRLARLLLQTFVSSVATKYKADAIADFLGVPTQEFSAKPSVPFDIALGQRTNKGFGTKSSDKDKIKQLSNKEVVELLDRFLQEVKQDVVCERFDEREQSLLELLQQLVQRA